MNFKKLNEELAVDYSVQDGFIIDGKSIIITDIELKHKIKTFLLDFFKGNNLKLAEINSINLSKEMFLYDNGAYYLYCTYSIGGDVHQTVDAGLFIDNYGYEKIFELLGLKGATIEDITEELSIIHDKNINDNDVAGFFAYLFNGNYTSGDTAVVKDNSLFFITEDFEAYLDRGEVKGGPVSIDKGIFDVYVFNNGIVDWYVTKRDIAVVKDWRNIENNTLDYYIGGEEPYYSCSYRDFKSKIDSRFGRGWLIDDKEKEEELEDLLDAYYKELNESTLSDVFKLYTAGFIKEDGTFLYADENEDSYHGGFDEETVNAGYPEFSNTHWEVDTCIRLYKEPNEVQYKKLEEIIDKYLDNEGYCKVEIWNNGKYNFYKVYSLYEGACEDNSWEEEIGNWTGYELVQIIKNYFNNKVEEELSVQTSNENLKDYLIKISNWSAFEDDVVFILKDGFAGILSPDIEEHDIEPLTSESVEACVILGFGLSIRVPYSEISEEQVSFLKKLINHFDSINGEDIDWEVDVVYETDREAIHKTVSKHDDWHSADEIVADIKNYYRG